jgi:large subunit ribosomal protein L19
MPSLIQIVEAKYKKRQIVPVKSGDTVAVHQKIKEGAKERVQVFEGMVINTSRMGSVTASITVRRIASGVGVEKSFILHHPNVLKVIIKKRGKVRRNYLTYMRGRRGKSSRLTGMEFDKQAVNTIVDIEAEKEEEKLREEALAQHEADMKAEAEKAAAEEKKHEAEFKAHEELAEELVAEEKTEAPKE